VAPIRAATAWRWGTDVRRLWVASLLLTLAWAPVARAAEWGTIVPAVSTMETVRAQFGGPTRSESVKVEQYDTQRWTYEGAQAPTGMQRMVVDFGLLQAGGFRRELVRTFRLEPRPGVFPRLSVINGWGRPDLVGTEGGVDSFVYEEGLIVVFDKEGASATSMVFTPPQPSVRGRSQR
jgi:hypothetical protein